LRKTSLEGILHATRLGHHAILHAALKRDRSLSLTGIFNVGELFVAFTFVVSLCKTMSSQYCVR
jgi:hypothetical protein